MDVMGGAGPTPISDTEKAKFYLRKLQDLTELFELKYEDYAAMEKKMEGLRKVQS